MRADWFFAAGKWAFFFPPWFHACCQIPTPASRKKISFIYPESPLRWENFHLVDICKCRELVHSFLTFITVRVSDRPCTCGERFFFHHKFQDRPFHCAYMAVEFANTRNCLLVRRQNNRQKPLRLLLQPHLCFVIVIFILFYTLHFYTLLIMVIQRGEALLCCMIHQYFLSPYHSCDLSHMHN